MRVLLVDLEPAWRGGQAQALLLLAGLRALGHDAELLSLRNSALAQRARSKNIPVTTVAAGSAAVAQTKAAYRLSRMLAEHRFDLVHANDAHALTTAWLARAHRHVPLVAARRVAFPVSRGRPALARYRAAARILAVSQAVREKLLSAGLDPARIAVVPDGVETPPRVSPEKRRAARKRWGIAAEERVAGYVASLSGEKGHALLLDAFAVIHAQHPGCRLLLAGDGPLRAELEQKARAVNLLPAALFAGFVEDIESVYAACDVFLFPSLNEGLGTSLLSAMASALPVVAFSVGGISDAVENGRNGLLVKEITPRGLADAAGRLLTDAALAQRLAEAAFETIAVRFTASRMVENTLAIFESLLATPPRRQTARRGGS